MISVIIPVYNAAMYLRDCLESILNQSYKDLEIILVNDGSTDRSGEICWCYQNKYNNIRVVYQENQGVSKARNQGINLARGEYISFIDADDWLEKNYYECLLYLLTKYDADVSMCDYSVEDSGKLLSSARKHIEVCYEGLEAVHYIVGKMRGGPCDKLYKKSVIGTIRFDESIKIAEDTLFNAMVMKNISRLVKVDYKLYHYRMWKGNTSGKWTIGKVESGFCAYEKMLQLYYGNITIISVIRCAMKICLLHYFDYAISSGDKELYLYLQKIYDSDKRMNNGFFALGIKAFIKMQIFRLPYAYAKLLDYLRRPF